MRNFKVLDTIALAMFLFGILLATLNQISSQEQAANNSMTEVSPQQTHLLVHSN